MRRFLRSTPIVFVLIFLWALLRWLGADFTIGVSYGTILSLAFIIGCFAILVLEFYKSGNVSLRAFTLDQALAVVALASATALSTVFWAIHETFYLVDIFVALAVLTDAILSPVNSFRVALRSFAAGTAGPSADTE